MHHLTTLIYFVTISPLVLIYSALADDPREPRIIGGKNAAPGKFPYMVSIQHNGIEHNCGGGIIDDRFILTAAHCIISTASKELFEVSMKVVYDDNGNLQEADGYSTNQLRFASVKIITNEECKLSGYWTGPKRKITNNHICGYLYQHNPDNKPEGVCSGDSGSPLVIGNTVVGIVSFSPKGCNETVHPAKYTRVSPYLDFIQAVLKGRLNDDILEFDILQPQNSSENDRPDCVVYPVIPGFHPIIPGCP